MTEPTKSRSESWKRRLLILRMAVMKVAPFFAGMLATLCALIIYGAIFPGPKPLTSKDMKEIANQVLASATPAPAYSSRVYQIIRPSLILIQTTGVDEKGKEQYGLGSGVIVNDAGNILTSLHVVANSKEIKLTFADGTQANGSIVTAQADQDIALLEADQLPAAFLPATLGNPNAMRVGDEAFAVGNPFGLYGSMSAGVISGFNRTFHPENSDQELKGLIQIDTSVNPGNSGGPLVNRYGHVVGIVTGLVNPTGQDVFIGIGFAVPITTAGGAMGSPLY